MSDDTEDTRNGVFAIMWDCYGLEAVTKLPDPADTTFALLKGNKPPEMPNLNMWALRARYNNQRHYEIYVITAVPGIDVNHIRDMFEANPQHAAETIRCIGEKFYSDRVVEDKIVIR